MLCDGDKGVQVRASTFKDRAGEGVENNADPGGAAAPLPFEEIHSPVGNGFRFAAQAFARVVARGDFAAIERAAKASLDDAATLEALAASAKSGAMVEVAGAVA